jgi:hypothetical protein
MTQNTALSYFTCYNNLLSALDVSQNTLLWFLNCSQNQLECLNVSNGNNNNMPNSISALGNPNLTCITVDDAAFSTTNWTVTDGNIDSQMSFSTNCGDACSPLGISELNTNTSKKLSKIIDLTGREIQFKKNTMIIYIYEDGSSEKVFEFE